MSGGVIMAVSEKAKLGISALPEEAREKIGGYKEAPGGGTPLGAGEKAPSKEWVAANRKMQPRDADGQFTYNSVNAKPLEYGPSRGKTVPPFLRGVQQNYARKKGDVIIGEDGKRYLASIDLSADDLVNIYKRYIESKGDFNVGEKEFKGKTGRQSKKKKRRYPKVIRVGLIVLIRKICQRNRTGNSRLKIWQRKPLKRKKIMLRNRAKMVIPTADLQRKVLKNFWQIVLRQERL